MDALAFLFADVGQLPIITSPSQEFWLGVQSAAPQNWGELDSYDDPVLLAAIHASLRMRFSKLEAACASANLTAPQLEIWTDEVLKAYQDIYGFQRSRLLQSIRSATACSDGANLKLAAKIYDLVELLCLMPEPALGYLVNAAEEEGEFPTRDQFHAWTEHHPIKHVWQLAEERAKQARATMVTGYLRYVLRIARGSVGQGVEYMDLVQEGALGLMRAAERFDYREGARFAVFASSWIWQGIGRAVADQGRTIRLPVHMHERIYTLQKALETSAVTDELEAITADCLSSIAGEEQEQDDDESVESKKPSTMVKMRRKAYRLLEYCQPMVPLDLELPDGLFEGIDLADTDPVTLADCIVDQRQNTEIDNQRKEWQPMVQALLADIWGGDSRDLQIVRLRYGLDDGQEYTLEEVGQRFGLTRERIRQIESRVLQKLKRAWQQKYGAVTFAEPTYYSSVPRGVQRHIEERFNAWRSAVDRVKEREQYHLDHYLAQLPGGDWHAYRVPGSSTRQEQVAMALRILETPAHYTAITEQVNNLVGNTQLDETYIYGLLMKYEEAFVRLGEGFFSLAEWERQRVAEAEPGLSFCPIPLPDPPDQPNAFLESVMVARDILRTPCSIEVFLRALVKWAGLPWPQPHWVCQGALSAYYVVGVIPYVFYTPGENRQLSLTLPDADLQALRAYCLDTLSRRLQAMSEFWWLLQRHQPIRVTELAQLFVTAHPLGLDDVANRLTLLTGIGAVQRSSYGGRYQLTRLGETLAARWARQPENLSAAMSAPPTEEEWDFAELLLD